MKATIACLLLSFAIAPAIAQERAAAAEPFLVEHSLWLKPGRTAQFLALFERVERPRLEELRKQGKVLWYRTAQPVLSGRNDDWDVRVTVAWRSAEDASAALRAGSSHGDAGRGRALPGETEKRLLDELVLDQHQTWLHESGGP